MFLCNVPILNSFTLVGQNVCRNAVIKHSTGTVSLSADPNIVPYTGRAHLKRDGTRAETRFGLSAKRTSPFTLAGGGSVQSTTGSRGVRISGSNGSNAGYTMF